MEAEVTPRSFRTEGPIWLRDFEFGPTELVVRSTGARVPYTPAVLADVRDWFRYFFAIKATKPFGQPFNIYFTPERARPWYLIWSVSRLAGAKLVKDPSLADVVMQFQDSTYSPNPAPLSIKPGARLINFGCTDVSKTRVAHAFEETFGYQLMVDPTIHTGEAVEKSELNAAHDGRIIQCPAPAQPGKSYQRVIDNRGIDLDHVDDLRTCTLGGKPIVTFIKRRPVSKRFLNSNTEIILTSPDKVFSAEEMEKIGAFTRAIGLDWGGVDVLRDRNDGRLYIVDANKTDMGPPIALNLPDKLKAAHILAEAFAAFVRGPAK